MVLILLFTTVIFFIAYAGLIIYYRQCWQQLPTYAVPLVTANTTRVTVIIPARNEADNIGLCVQSIINQTYPADLFEVIVVDDHSTDNTAAIVKAFNLQNIHCIFLKDYVTAGVNSYKKKAIEVAIAQSLGELIVTTDADCFMGKDWLKTIACFYEQYQPAFIAAPVNINSRNRFLEIFQALDFMTLQGITGASVYKKFHSMCNGANLAYEKTAFNAVDGFAGIDTIASGDDMLLMHKIFSRYPQRVLFLKSPVAIVHTAAMDTLKGFFNQRIRWASKADKYQDKSILPVLVIVYFLNVLFLLLPVIALFNKIHWLLFGYSAGLFTCWLWLLVAKTMVEIIFLYPVAQFFKRKQLLWWFPIAQPVHILYTVIAGWLGKFGTYQWKERKVK